jgi:hypothetical protein
MREDYYIVQNSGFAQWIVQEMGSVSAGATIEKPALDM